MAGKRVFTSAGLTWGPTNLGSAAATLQFMEIKGASATQTTDILEVLFSGKATASTVAAIELTRVTTDAGTPTTLATPHSDGPMHPATAALSAPVVTTVAATTGPVPSNVVTDGKLNLGLNLFGGIIRWNASPTQQWTLVGNATGPGMSMLFNNGNAGGSSGPGDAHIIYETY